jgi:membrane-bound metal-dependent hydrolase YbcI (DUF457 family)
MFITGHLASSYLVSRVTGLHWSLLAGAAVFPDLVDKGLRCAGLFATGRHVAHNLFALMLTVVAVAFWWGGRAGISWAVGYVVHLAGDLPFSWDMPWFYPLEWGAWHNSVPQAFMGMSWEQLLLDVCVTAVALGLLFLDLRKRAGELADPPSD